MHGKGNRAGCILVIGIETGPSCEVASVGGQAGIVWHKHSIAGLRDREVAGPIGQLRKMQDTIVGDCDCARITCARIYVREGLGYIVEGFCEGNRPLGKGTRRREQ